MTAALANKVAQHAAHKSFFIDAFLIGLFPDYLLADFVELEE